jgi:hypothetical protein
LAGDPGFVTAHVNMGRSARSVRPSREYARKTAEAKLQSTGGSTALCNCHPEGILTENAVIPAREGSAMLSAAKSGDGAATAACAQPLHGAAKDPKTMNATSVTGTRSIINLGER